MSRRETVRLGCGAGTSDDRLEPALELAEKGDIDYLVFECLAERTIARENLARSSDPELGYTPSLHERMPLVLPACVERKSASSAIWAPPIPRPAPARRAGTPRAWACATSPAPWWLATMSARSLSACRSLPLMETGEPLEALLPRMVSANAYLGADTVKARARHRRRCRADRPGRRPVAVPRHRDAPFRLGLSGLAAARRRARSPAICSNARVR